MLSISLSESLCVNLLGGSLLAELPVYRTNSTGGDRPSLPSFYLGLEWAPLGTQCSRCSYVFHSFFDSLAEGNARPRSGSPEMKLAGE